MTAPDFDKYSLCLFFEGGEVFKSRAEGLSPLVDALDFGKWRFKSCILHDRIIGLAAARLIVYSGMIAEVISCVSSRSASILLQKEGIVLRADEMVENILATDGSSIHPAEAIALDTDDPANFINKIRKFARKEIDADNCRGQCGYTPWCEACKAARQLEFT
ncbi:MAG: hypothetical protein CSYNP_02412 [Syntrophus sp. SKADARSKE-3]|nr:hypothetical protein [Syntrophus sp. SKADARSKE-3]